ncbi:hypothetical protein SERLA73DRAFT_159161 [Serpula lacrymans var. lacrymans S7.3]|uniref:Mitochondrial distribution and morphology protein 34 n=2 Tax=Serpula lacrymans var. lacrymans TaxID=341189 RepID=F8PPW0_SERL3|nr:uncharacterized protein SERLADRAFT_435497 [Serpula lacrymans var. lacrymans S7.9]EGO02114.1 hypothetical protein SERLA73DRAFT_159161 [Serpula lacrymans var. lacrymans S7.3]EGO27738.1 hypothetical protein SERLADRAFT_435497 [Serpula lacrymans var. lacrymans S7.9]
MSFTFEWPRFSDQFHTDAIQMLNNALNKGNKPPVIADKIEVVELEMGTQPPELEIRDIGDMTMDQFRGIFRLTYSGDAHIVLKTKVQANPLNHKQPDIHIMTGSRGMLAAREPLVVPMLLRLSHFKLSSYVVLVVSKQKGITLVFKTDPLQNVDINSTFDSIAVIQKFIQKEIEGQLRQMFREDLPGIIHRLSQQWVKAKVEAPYLDKQPNIPRRGTFDSVSVPDISRVPPSVSAVGLHPHILRQQSLGTLSYGRARSVSGFSAASSSKKSTPASILSTTAPGNIPAPDPAGSFPELDNFDPTYGLRPEGLPAKSVFTSFGRLFAPNKGLADLAEESSDVEDLEEGTSFDVVDWEDTVPDFSPPPTISEEPESPTEYETIPAVGGGTITRPRVYHSQSMIQPPPGMSRLPSEASSFRSVLSHRTLQSHVHPNDEPHNHDLLSRTPSRPSISGRPSSNYNPYFSDAYLPSNKSQRTRSEPAFDLQQPASIYPRSRRPVTPDSLETQFSRSSSGVTQPLETPPSADQSYDNASEGKRSLTHRRMSVSSSTNLDVFHSGSPPNSHHIPEPDPKIILRPSLNNTIHKLSTLSHSNHTLSPYTRSLEHFTVRSVPPRVQGASGLSVAYERPTIKARRKRTYRIGGRSANKLPDVPPPFIPSSPSPPSEFDQSDVDRYFRSQDDFSAEPHSHVRKRKQY